MSAKIINFPVKSTVTKNKEEPVIFAVEDDLLGIYYEIYFTDISHAKLILDQLGIETTC